MIASADLDELNLRLQPRYRSTLLEGRNACFQFHTDKDGDFHLIADADGCEFRAGAAAAPSIRLFVDTLSTVRELLTGELDGTTAFMNGQYRSDGNIVLSQVLLYLFRNLELHAADVRD